MNAVKVNINSLIDPPKIEYLNLPQRSNNDEWILKTSAGYASRLGILFNNNETWRYAFECLDRSSKQRHTSYPLSLILSLIEIAIKGIIKDNNDDDEEWLAIIKENQFNIPKKYISFESNYESLIE